MPAMSTANVSSATGVTDGASTTFQSYPPSTTTTTTNLTEGAGAVLGDDDAVQIDEYQLAISLSVIIGACVLIIVLVVLVVYRKTQSQNIATARQKLVQMGQEEYQARQVAFSNQLAAHREPRK